MFGDVNISAILDSLSVSYDKRVRPNYGGLFDGFLTLILKLLPCLALRIVHATGSVRLWYTRFFQSVYRTV